MINTLVDRINIAKKEIQNIKNELQGSELWKAFQHYLVYDCKYKLSKCPFVDCDGYNIYYDNMIIHNFDLVGDYIQIDFSFYSRHKYDNEVYSESKVKLPSNLLVLFNKQEFDGFINEEEERYRLQQIGRKKDDISTALNIYPELKDHVRALL